MAVWKARFELLDAGLHFKDVGPVALGFWHREWLQNINLEQRERRITGI